MNDRIDRERENITKLLTDLNYTKAQATRAIREETGHDLSHATIGRVLKGDTKVGMIVFIRYALENIFKKVNRNPKLSGKLTHLKK